MLPRLWRHDYRGKVGIGMDDQRVPIPPEVVAILRGANRYRYRLLAEAGWCIRCFREKVWHKVPALIGVVMFLSVAVLAFAQETPDASKSPPATKLEAFSARTGIVLIKAFSTVGAVNGMGTVTIDAREFRDASNPKLREYGIAIAVKESGRLERENTSYIDFDEIDSLLAGIEYISKIDNSITTMQEFEGEYRTKV